MKKSILLAFFALAFFCARAQTEKGNFALGLHNYTPGSFVLGGLGFTAPSTGLGFNFGTTKYYEDGKKEGLESKYTSVGLNFNGHYFVANNFSIGLGANILNAVEKYKDSDGSVEEEINVTMLLGGPELRYFIPVSSKMKVYIRGTGNFGRVEVSFGDTEEEDPAKLSYVSGQAGLAYFPNPHVSLDMGLGYNVLNIKEKDTSSSGTIDTKNKTGNVSVDLGFTVFF